jgi:TRAP-type mannitol/chloroaromatic compound transport system substrate-binding protein
MKEATTMERRRFIVKAGGTLAVAGAAATVSAPYVIAQPKIQWRMSTAWTPTILYQSGAERLAKVVEEMSGGRFRIEVFPGGQIMGPFECFEAASQGKIEAFHAGALFWGAREPALQWFTTVPFGMNCEGMTAWFYQGDGLKLWEETYAPFNLVPRPGSQSAPEMGGWFRRKVTTIADYKGLKMRIPGLGGKVVARAGATVVTMPPGEIYAALERGVIDTSEFVCPHDDMILGLHKTAPYYYYPGWHQPGTTTEFSFNKKAYEALPVDLRRVLDHATAAAQAYSLTEFHAKNANALGRLRTEFKGQVEILQFPAPMMRELKRLAAEVVREESEKTPMARKVHASFTKFQALVGPWDHVAEGAYHQLVAQ